MKYDLSAVVGTYTDKNGEVKNLNKTFGKMWQNEKGQYKIVIDSWFNPAACKKNDDGSVWVNVYEQKQKSSQMAQDGDNYQEPLYKPKFDHPGSALNSGAMGGVLNDDLPFMPDRS